MQISKVCLCIVFFSNTCLPICAGNRTKIMNTIVPVDETMSDCRKIEIKNKKYRSYSLPNISLKNYDNVKSIDTFTDVCENMQIIKLLSFKMMIMTIFICFTRILK